MEEQYVISRFAVDSDIEGDDIKLCECCADDHGLSQTRDSVIELGCGERYNAYWIETYVRDIDPDHLLDVGEHRCEECDVYHGACKDCEELPEDCECADDLW